MNQLNKKERTDRETETEEIRLSVRAFVEFLLRSGDFAGRRGGWADRDAMQAGARAHRKIQKSRGEKYRAEVPLKWEHVYPSCRLLLEGRADGIYEEDGIPVIEEIKGTYGDLDLLEEAVPVHLAQARCYACMYAEDHACTRICICMTYVQLDTEEVRQFVSEEEVSGIREWLQDLLDQYERWAEFRAEKIRKRNAAIKGLPFPFPYREGQKKLVEDVYRTILRKKQVFVQAPTGVGKTISTIYPSVMAMGEGLAERIFYLTAKTSAGMAAEEAFRILMREGLSCKCLTMTAREKICPQTEIRCDPVHCPRAAGHYDRINDVLYSTLTGQDLLDRETVACGAEEGNVCPYEMQADLLAFADAVIADYNYVFDPNARLRGYGPDGQGASDTVFLIDEAHNLVDRGREMFSADLTRDEFQALRRALKGREDAGAQKLSRQLQKTARILLDMRKESEEEQEQGKAYRLPAASAGALIPSLLNLTGSLEDILQTEQEGELREQLLAFYFRISTFIQIFELADERYITYGIPLGKNGYFLKVFCVDPSGDLQKILDKGRSTVFFSATLIPVRYYKKLLSAREDDYAIAVPSPFPEKNRKILIGTDISARYTRRTEEEFTRMAAYISAAVSAREGRYMVFFPSYQLLEAVGEIYAERKQESETLLLQKRDMTEKEKDTFLSAFLQEGSGTVTGFCVMGGSFAESIDLRGEALVGAVVIGTGIPQIGQERELLKEYYGRDGFSYAYRIPGMNKVLQAAGRVIRTTEDVGWILLLDERFLFEEYREYFPPAWKDRELCTLQNVGHKIREFWLTILT